MTDAFRRHPIASAVIAFLVLIVLMVRTDVGITLSAWSVEGARAMLGWFG